MGRLKFICRMIVKGKIDVPENRIHFHVKGMDGNDYTDIPFNYHYLEEVCDDLKKYENINQINTQTDPISKQTKECIETARELNLKSFLLESFTDYGDSYPIDDLITVIIDEEKIFHESLFSPVDQNDGDRYKDIYEYEYEEILYYGYEFAQLKYQKILDSNHQ